MKKKKTFIRQVFFAFIVLPLFLFLCIACEQVKKDYTADVMKAYEIRINGDADSAKVILDQILAEDSTLAMAWYELARTEQHMGLGDMQKMMEHHDLAVQNIEKALKLDPYNPAYLYFKGKLQSFGFYAAMQMGGGNAQDDLKKIEETYMQLLEVDPEFYAAKLALVELYGSLPNELGGDSARAEAYAKDLENEDLICGAKAREILMPQDADYVAYWNGLIEQNEGNADLIEALGRMYLFENNTDEAWKCFGKALELDENRNYLYVDMGRYYMMMGMQRQIPVDSAVPLIFTEFEKYLASQPEPSNPMKAWTKGQMAMLKFRTGDEETGKMLSEEAKALDAYYSRAFGTPGKLLFIPPDSVSQSFDYLSRPF